MSKIFSIKKHIYSADVLDEDNYIENFKKSEFEICDYYGNKVIAWSSDSDDKFIYKNSYKSGVLRIRETHGFEIAEYDVFTREYFNEYGLVTLVLRSYDNRDFRIEYNYDDENRLNKITNIHLGLPEHLNKTTDKYEYPDNYTTVINRSEHGKNSTEYRYFDSHKRLTIKKTIEKNTPDQTVTENQYQYDDNHNVIYEKYYTQAIRTTRMNFDNFDMDRLFSEPWTMIERLDKPDIQESSQITKYRYEYDSHNNWVKKFIFRNDQMVSVELREIDYFEEIE